MPESRPRRFSDIARQAESDLDEAWGSDPAASPARDSEQPSSWPGSESSPPGTEPATADDASVPPDQSAHVIEPDPLTLADDPGEWADEDELVAPEPVAPDPAVLEPVAPAPWEPALPPSVEAAHHAPVAAEPSLEAGPVSFSDAVTTVMPAIERPDSPVHFDQPHLTGAAALRQQVLLGGTQVPLWTLFAAGIGTALLLGGVIAQLVLGGTAAERPLPVPSVGLSAAVAPSAGPSTLAEQAALGDPTALRQLEKRAPEDRSVDESFAVALGRELEQRAELEKLATRVRGRPALATDPETLEKLLEFVANPRTGTAALKVVATLPGSIGPDILYEVWTGTPERNDTTRLAEELVSSREVRVKASPALLVALDLRRTEECDAVAAILPRAIQHGDSRSLRMLGKLVQRTGCGPRKAKDCYPCLRDGELVMDAINAVRKRRAPKLL